MWYQSSWSSDHGIKISTKNYPLQQIQGDLRMQKENQHKNHTDVRIIWKRFLKAYIMQMLTNTNSKISVKMYELNGNFRTEKYILKFKTQE